MKTNQTESTPGMRVINVNVAGIDIGSEENWVCVPQGRAAEHVRVFRSMTADLQEIGAWLKQCGVTSVAMESTGVYWIPLYEVLEELGFEVCLVNTRSVKAVPGRKSDYKDCQWLQELHSYGLLQGSFHPPEDIRVLRTYVRQRADLIEHRAAHIQHMQKALQQMNLKLSLAVSDVTGKTGMSIIRAILGGEHNPKVLSKLRDGRCHSSEAEIERALTGHYRKEHLFALKQAVALYDFYTQQIQECDAEIERHYGVIRPKFEGEDDPPYEPPSRPGPRIKNAPPDSTRENLFHMVKLDLCQILGINASTLQTVLSEIGVDMSKWRTAKQLTAWLDLAPRNDISGGKVIRSHILHTHNRAGQALRMAAQSVGRTQTDLGAFYRRIKARKGARVAIVATARKLACLIHHLLSQHEPYQGKSAEDYQKEQKARTLKSLERKAAQLGYHLSPDPAG
jgi:transposase